MAAGDEDEIEKLGRKHSLALVQLDRQAAEQDADNYIAEWVEHYGLPMPSRYQEMVRVVICGDPLPRWFHEAPERSSKRVALQRLSELRC